MTPKKKVNTPPAEVVEIVSLGCGFAPENPHHPEKENDGTAVLQIWSNGAYDVICSYYNAPCRHNCQILKVIHQSKQNENLEDYEAPDTDETKLEGEPDTDE